MLFVYFLFIYLFFRGRAPTHVALMRGRFANGPEKRGCAEMEGKIVIFKRDSDFHEYLKADTRAEEGRDQTPERRMRRRSGLLAGIYCARTRVSSCP